MTFQDDFETGSLVTGYAGIGSALVFEILNQQYMAQTTHQNITNIVLTSAAIGGAGLLSYGLSRYVRSRATAPANPNPQNLPAVIQPPEPTPEERRIELQGRYDHWRGQIETILDQTGHIPPTPGSMADRDLHSADAARQRTIDEAIENNVRINL